MVLSVRFIGTIAVLLGLSLVLFANTVLANTNFIRQALAPSHERYQIGETWSRVPYDGRLTSTEALNKAISATARVLTQLNNSEQSTGTSFYLGKVGHQHVMMTNYHVMSTFRECKNTKLYFPSLKLNFRCGRILGAFADTESTFFTIQVSNKNEWHLENKALQFDFVNEYKPGHKIVVAGFGIYNNHRQLLTYDNSQTCVVATTTYQSRKLYSKQGSTIYGAYSFVHACEISKGDSGAAIVSEETGKVIGINWATSTAKPAELLSTHTVFDWIEKKDSRIWSSLSYGVPAGNIMNDIKKSKEPILHELLSMNLASNLQ